MEHAVEDQRAVRAGRRRAGVAGGMDQDQRIVDLHAARGTGRIEPGGMGAQCGEILGTQILIGRHQPGCEQAPQPLGKAVGRGAGQAQRQQEAELHVTVERRSARPCVAREHFGVGNGRRRRGARPAGEMLLFMRGVAPVDLGQPRRIARGGRRAQRALQRVVVRGRMREQQPHADLAPALLQLKQRRRQRKAQPRGVRLRRRGTHGAAKQRPPWRPLGIRGVRRQERHGVDPDARWIIEVPLGRDGRVALHAQAAQRRDMRARNRHSRLGREFKRPALVVLAANKARASRDFDIAGMARRARQQQVNELRHRRARRQAQHVAIVEVHQARRKAIQRLPAVLEQLQRA
ncbi:hypothetical protein D3C81_1280010 [compost metagenome]